MILRLYWVVKWLGALYGVTAVSGYMSAVVDGVECKNFRKVCGTKEIVGSNPASVVGAPFFFFFLFFFYAPGQMGTG